MLTTAAMTAATGNINSQEARARREMLASCMTCPLCNKLFNNAITISDCLHTFCRKCIYEKIRKADCCPVCHIDLGCIPLKKLRVDHKLQNLKTKIFPSTSRNAAAVDEVGNPAPLPVKRKERFLSLLSLSAPLRPPKRKEPTGGSCSFPRENKRRFVRVSNLEKVAMQQQEEAQVEAAQGISTLEINTELQNQVEKQTARIFELEHLLEKEREKREKAESEMAKAVSLTEKGAGKVQRPIDVVTIGDETINTLNMSVSRLESSLTVKTRHHQTLLKSYNEVKAQLALERSKADHLQFEMAKAMSLAQYEAGKVRNLTDATTFHESTIDTLKKSVSLLESSLAEKTEHHQSLLKSYNEAKIESALHRSTADHLKSMMAKAFSLAEMGAYKVQKFMDAATFHEDTMDTLKNSVCRLENSLTEKSKQYKEVKAELLLQRSWADHFKSQMDNAVSRAEKGEDKVRELLDILTFHDGIINTLKKSMSRLENSLAEKTQYHQTLLKSYNDVISELVLERSRASNLEYDLAGKCHELARLKESIYEFTFNG